tara:strand:- start:53 stop:319 length:267 start_codon:yes stop_codon:yes gene_type:complete
MVVARLLALVAMQRRALQAALAKVLHHGLAPSLLLAEDDHLARAAHILQYLEEDVQLVRLVALLEALVDALRGAQLRGIIHLHEHGLR